MDKITIERETLERALDAVEAALSDDQPYITKCKEVCTGLRAALAAQPAPAQPADPVQRLSDEQIDAVTRDKFGTSLLGAEIAMHREYGRAIESALQTKATK